MPSIWSDFFPHISEIILQHVDDKTLRTVRACNKFSLKLADKVLARDIVITFPRTHIPNPFTLTTPSGGHIRIKPSWLAPITPLNEATYLISADFAAAAAWVRYTRTLDIVSADRPIRLGGHPTCILLKALELHQGLRCVRTQSHTRSLFCHPTTPFVSGGCAVVFCTLILDKIRGVIGSRPLTVNLPQAPRISLHLTGIPWAPLKDTTLNILTASPVRELVVIFAPTSGPLPMFLRTAGPCFPHRHVAVGLLSDIVDLVAKVHCRLTIVGIENAGTAVPLIQDVGSGSYPVPQALADLSSEIALLAGVDVATIECVPTAAYRARIGSAQYAYETTPPAVDGPYNCA